MPRLEDPKQHGDLLARVRLVLPEPMSEREVNAIRELKKDRQEA
jgi:curved DNA-binding protein